MTDRTALLAAICRDPADDTVRMVYADRLQEQAGSVECPAGCRVPSPRRDGIYCTYDSAGPESRWVKCSTCSGSGRVSNGNAERAEFIRAAVELARLGPPRIVVKEPCVVHSNYGPNYYSLTGGEKLQDGGLLISEVKVGSRVDVLHPQTWKRNWKKPLYGLRCSKITEDEVILVRDLESRPWGGELLQSRTNALLTAHEAEWRRGDKCEECELRRYYVDGRLKIINRAGCKNCHGTGFAGSLAKHAHIVVYGPAAEWQPWTYKADWSRGFVSTVHAPLADVFQGEKVTDWAVQVAREWPLEKWVLTDREPSEANGYHDGPNAYKLTHDWYVSPTDDPDDIPRSVMDEMRRQHPEWNYQNDVLECLARESALDALARAVAEVVRREAWTIEEVRT